MPGPLWTTAPAAKSFPSWSRSQNRCFASSVPGAGPLPLGGTGVVPPGHTLGHTVWDLLAADIEIQQARIAQAEQTLTPTVVAAAAGCRNDSASPAP